MPSATTKKLEIVRLVGRLGAHAVREKVRPVRPTSIDQVPASPELLTVEWLTAALCSAHPGATVTGYSLGGGSDGSTSRRAITVTYNDAGTAAGLPTRLFTKATPKFTSRVMTMPSGALAMEKAFYNDIRPGLDVEAPIGYYADVDLGSGRSMFLLEDIAQSRGATFGGPTELSIDRSQAEDQVRLLANVHGTFWESPRLRGDGAASDLAWIKSAKQFQVDCNETIGFESRCKVGAKRALDITPVEFARRADEAWPALMRSIELHEAGPMTLLHSDVHIGNWYVTGAGRMGLCDWQLMTRGVWALDLSYALTSGLTIENRRAWERELIELYLDTLAAAGGKAPDFEQAWLAYRQQVFHGLFFWLYTIGYGPMQPKMQPDEACRENLRRMTQAAVDFDALDIV